jgi:D-Tyr-tRNAtyr deacylase
MRGSDCTNYFVEVSQQTGIPVATGIFQADMQVGWSMTDQ